MAQLLIYISQYLAIGACINAIGIIGIRYTGHLCGRLKAKLEIMKGQYNQKMVDEELSKSRETFNDTSWWMKWWTKMVLLWPKAIILYANQIYKLVNEIIYYEKELDA